MRNFLIASALRHGLVGVVDRASGSRRAASGSSRSCARRHAPACRVLDSQAGSASASRVTSAAMNGRWSPTTMHWLTSAVRAQPVLEHGRGDVLAARGHEDLLLAAGDPQEAVVVELAEVAGVEPAVARSPRAVAVVVVPVAAQHVAAADAAPRRRRRSGPSTPGSGRPTVPIRDRVGVVHGGRGGRLGQAVALEDGDADAAEEVAEPRRRAARRRRPRTRHAAAQRGRAACRRPACRTARAGPCSASPGRRCPAPRYQAMATWPRPVEDLALAVGLRLCLGGVVDLLEDPRHGQDEGRLELAEVVEQVLDVGGVARCRARGLDAAAPG